MQPENINDFMYVDSNEKLRECCRSWSTANLLALDTEFIRTDTYYPIGALIQLSDGENCYLIDPLAITEFDGFKAILTNEAIVKVLHSCSEDLEVFYRLFGVLPSPLIDTQIAAGLDGYGFSLGYQRLTEALLQIHVPKGETRSNWLKRPLSESQLHYAMLDVAYLPAMYQMLVESLQAKGRFEWLRQDCNRMLSQFSDLDAIPNYYKKIKSAWKLSSRQLAVLQTVIEWREHKAREWDKPRGRVLKDKSCYEIARLQPLDTKQLAAIDEIGMKTVRNSGQEILDLIRQAQNYNEADLPERMAKPLPPETGSVLKQLKSRVKLKADQLVLAQELLVKRRDYEALLISGTQNNVYTLPDSLSDWRKDVIGDELLSMLNR